jgi:hypothetical protein
MVQLSLEKLLEQGTSIDEMPSFIFDGIDAVVKTQKQIILEELQDQAEQQQAEEQAIAAQEQQMQQGEQGVPLEEGQVPEEAQQPMM